MNNIIFEQLADVFENIKLPGEHIHKAELWESDIDILMKVIACNLRAITNSNNESFEWIENIEERNRKINLCDIYAKSIGISYNHLYAIVKELK